MVHCDFCQFHYYQNSAAASGAFILHEGRLVLCVRAKDPAKGMLDLPGGFVDFDESVETATRREILEELNLNVRDFTYLCSAPNNYLYRGVPYKTSDLFFVCYADDIGNIVAADDVEGYLLLKPSEVDPARLAFPSTRLAFCEFLEWFNTNGNYSFKRLMAGF